MWALLTILAAAAPLPICTGTRHLAEDGRCAGSEAPWAIQSGGTVTAIAVDPHTLLVSSLPFDLDRPTAFLGLLDTATGAVIPLLQPFAGAGIPWLVRAGDHVLALGPLDHEADTFGGEVRRLDPVTGTWSVGAPWPAPTVGAAGGALDDGRLLLTGGTRSGALTADAWLYDPARDRWERLPAAPTARFMAATLPLDAGALVCGGFAGPWRDGRPDAAKGCDLWNGRSWRARAVDPPADELFPAGRVGDRRVAGGRGRVWWVDGATGQFADGPRIPKRADEVPPRPGPDDTPWIVAHDGVWRLTADAWERQALTLTDEGIPIPLGDGRWLELPFDRPARIVRADGVLRLGIGWFPEGVALPGGGVALVGRDGALAVRADGSIDGLPAVPAPPHDAAFAALPDGTLVLAGGTDGNMNPLRATWVLPPRADAWVPGPPLPGPIDPRTLDDAVAAALGDRVVVFGAQDARFGAWWSPGGAGWTPTDPPPFEPMRAIPLGDRVWVLGRPDRDGQRAAWLGGDGHWSALQPVPTAHFDPAIAVRADGTLLVLGGNHRADDVGGCPEVWAVDPVAGTWTPGPPLPDDSVGGTALALPDGRVVVIGGDRARVLWLEPGAEAWVAAPPTVRHRGNAVAALLADGRIAIAGTDGDGNKAAVVELYDPGSAPLPFPAPFAIPMDADVRRARCLAGHAPSCR